VAGSQRAKPRGGRFYFIPPFLLPPIPTPSTNASPRFSRLSPAAPPLPPFFPPGRALSFPSPFLPPLFPPGFPMK